MIPGFIIANIVFAFLIGFAGVKRRIGFWKSFFWSVLLSPFIGLIITLNSGRLDARGCMHCGNTYNEAEFCGMCNKNAEGLTRAEAAAVK